MSMFLLCLYEAGILLLFALPSELFCYSKYLVMVFSKRWDHFLRQFFKYFLDDVLLPNLDHESDKTEKWKHISLTLIVAIVHESL